MVSLGVLCYSVNAFLFVVVVVIIVVVTCVSQCGTPFSFILYYICGNGKEWHNDNTT